MQKLEVTGILEIIKPVLLVCTDLCHKNRLLESLNSKYPFKYWSLIKVHYGICAIGWYSIQLNGKTFMWKYKFMHAQVFYCYAWLLSLLEQ